MDMAVSDLLKHKIRFELESEESDYLENRFYSKGRQYSSRKIKNVESLGARNLTDLCLNQLQPFYQHVLSSMTEEIGGPIHHMEIKTSLSLTDGACGSKDLLGFTMDNPTNNVQLFNRCSRSTMHFYDFTDEEFWKDEAFYIIVEAYFYISPSRFNPLAQWILAGLSSEIAL